MTLRIDVLGTSVSIAAPAHLEVSLADALGDLPAGTGPGRELRLEPIGVAGQLRLMEAGVPLLSDIAEEIAVASVVWRLNAIAGSVSSHIVLHAGCVSSPAGAMLLPGSSGSGKSWLTAALVRAGFDYLSDEHAAIAVASGLLAPLAKPLDLGGPELVRACELRPDPVSLPCPPVGIVFPRFAPRSDVVLEPLDRAAALVELTRHCTSFTTQGPTAFRWLAGLAGALPAAVVTYGDADQAAATIADWEAPQGPDSAKPAAPAQPLNAVTPTSTTIEMGSDLVVLDELTGSVHRLNHSAGAVWLCASGLRERDAILARVAAETPPGAITRADVEAVLHYLTSIGLHTASTKGTV